MLTLLSETFCVTGDCTNTFNINLYPFRTEEHSCFVMIIENFVSFQKVLLMQLGSVAIALATPSSMAVATKRNVFISLAKTLPPAMTNSLFYANCL